MIRIGRSGNRGSDAGTENKGVSTRLILVLGTRATGRACRTRDAAVSSPGAPHVGGGLRTQQPGLSLATRGRRQPQRRRGAACLFFWFFAVLGGGGYSTVTRTGSEVGYSSPIASTPVHDQPVREGVFGAASPAFKGRRRLDHAGETPVAARWPWTPRGGPNRSMQRVVARGNV